MNNFKLTSRFIGALLVSLAIWFLGGGIAYTIVQSVNEKISHFIWLPFIFLTLISIINGFIVTLIVEKFKIVTVIASVLSTYIVLICFYVLLGGLRTRNQFMFPFSLYFVLIIMYSILFSILGSFCTRFFRTKRK